MSLISLKDVWLKYRVNFKENGRIMPEDFWALRGVDMDIAEGEVTGIIGENGAGKTTILKIIAGMLKPDRGVVRVGGTVSVLMEIGAGFQRDLTGKENIYHISSLFGLSKRGIDERYSDMVDFAAIGRFINAPVRVYSLGMYMRLAFSIAIHVDPDILIIDDTFAVGDIYAQRKCINKIFELKKKGKTIIFVAQDMEIIKRLCTRGIFVRDGTVIKEGPVDKVWSYYEESVGDKKGIAILQNGFLGVVFNNGRLVLRWKDTTITSQLSGHNIIFLPGKEYTSTMAEWQVQELTKDREIIAIVRWPDLPIVQRWRIFILNEKEFIWEIAMTLSKEIQVEKIRTIMVFKDSYKNWFTLDDETPFPEKFMHIWKWECTVVDDYHNNVVGLKDSDKTKEPLPTVVFDRVHDAMKMACQVGNTGSNLNGRGVIYEAFPMLSVLDNGDGQYKCFSTRIKIFDSKDSKNLENYLNDARKTIQESAIIRRDSLSLFCKDRKVELYWQDILITHKIGLNAKFTIQDRNYSAQDGRWTINKNKDEEIIVAISWDAEPGFIQTWRLKLEEGNRLIWCIDTKSEYELKIKNKQTEIILSEDYKEWLTMEEEGNFDKLGKLGNTVILDNYINNQVGVQTVYHDQHFVLPSLLFSSNSKNPSASYISKICEDVPATTLRYLEVDHKRSQSKGDVYFRGQVEVVGSRRIESDLVKKFRKTANIIVPRYDSLCKIGNSRISLVFNHGKTRVFWQGIELTKGLALYSSIRSSGMWYDSSQAFWEISGSDKGGFEVIGRWPWIPVVQIWKISLLDGSMFSWTIRQEAMEDIRLERAQVNLMLSDAYKGWVANKHIYGKFPGSFNKHNGFLWDRLWAGDIKSTIGIRKQRLGRGIFDRSFLPSVLLNCSENCRGHHCIVENTDDLFEARVLQCELDTDNKGVSKDDKYFEGKIRIVS